LRITLANIATATLALKSQLSGLAVMLDGFGTRGRLVASMGPRVRGHRGDGLTMEVCDRGQRHVRPKELAACVVIAFRPMALRRDTRSTTARTNVTAPRVQRHF